MKRQIVGLRSDHKKGPVYAEEIDGRLVFAALLRSGKKSGTVVRISAPILTSEQIVQLTKQRMAAFMATHGGRESLEMAVVRKAIAAQGPSTVQKAKYQMDAMLKMEFDMMLSKDSHTQGLPYEAGLGRPIIRMDASGGLTGRLAFQATVKELLPA